VYYVNGTLNDEEQSKRLTVFLLYVWSSKAMYGILKSGEFHNLSISCQLELFDKVVKPILLYGYELWRLSNCNIIERVYLKYCKIIKLFHNFNFAVAICKL
jgi:hypothetical protein